MCFDTINQLVQIIIRDILLAFLQQCNRTTCIWNIFLVVLENLLCIYIWNIITVFLQQCYNIIVRNIVHLSLENLLQLCYIDIFLVVVCQLLDTSSGEIIAISLNQQIDLTKWNILVITIFLQYTYQLVVQSITCHLTKQNLQLTVVDILVILTYILHYLSVGKHLIEIRLGWNIHSLLNAQQRWTSRRYRCYYMHIHLAAIHEVYNQILAFLQLIEEIIKINLVPCILICLQLQTILLPSYPVKINSTTACIHIHRLHIYAKLNRLVSSQLQVEFLYAWIHKLACKVSNAFWHIDRHIH